MCRNIKPLFNFEPPATEEEIRDASLQFVRKVSGYRQPSKVNQKAFDQSVEKITLVTSDLLNSLQTQAPPHDRATEAQKAHERALKRFN